MFTSLDLATQLMLMTIATILFAALLAKLFMPKPSNHGLRFEHEIKHRQRPQ